MRAGIEHREGRAVERHSDPAGEHDDELGRHLALPSGRVPGRDVDDDQRIEQMRERPPVEADEQVV